ncbi:DUF4179 domain-containing protein [Lederbergia panacisoli]|uniref:DUF4179 domain-containing protein n=1 Tax=Lederbergia panacisoli TaxID=1255251 RepID=UPI00214AF2CD|nr:DUF4179 domain-containing protein [Lederbergia panacisoli]MCR2823544.1 DUF4179 domain-containing protein [Lederbergia panacisoli]
MFPAKIEHMSITPIREKGDESIVEWFEQHKQSLYTIALSYLRNQQQVEEAFYQSILNVKKELHRFNRNTSFEMWATSIFLHICRELSDDKSLQVSKADKANQDLFSTFNRLKEDEKEAVVLTYIIGITRKEAAHLLQVSAEKLKELLFSGIQSLKKELGYGSSFIGCKENHKNYIDYFERNLDRSKKINFEMHIYHCQNCREDLGTFQDVMIYLNDRMEDLYVPSGFMENVKDRLAEKEKHRQQKNKKRNRIWFIFASVFAIIISIGFFPGAFPHFYYTWTEEDEQLRAFLQNGIGERMNLEAESNGIKIKLKSVIADDIQTLVFYEVEDTVKKSQYMIDYYEGVSVEKEYQKMGHVADLRYYPPDLKSDLNNKEENVYHGIVNLPPLINDSDTINLKITKLQKLIRDSSERNMDYVNIDYEEGEWNFEIPVKKLPSREYVLDEKIEVEGFPVRFDKLTIAPTTTILHSAFYYELPGKRISVLNFDNLKVNDKIVKADTYGNQAFFDKDDWISLQTHFEPLFGEKPKEVIIQFESVHLMIEDKKTIELDASKAYPQTFEYAGSTISIDKVEIGQPTKVVISNHEIENRAYEWIQFHVVGEEGEEIGSMGMNSEGVLVDKNWIEYDMNKNPFVYEEIEQPRYFFTVQSMELYNNNTEEKVIPKRLEIYEYSTTTYLDDVVKILLE